MWTLEPDPRCLGDQELPYDKDWCVCNNNSNNNNNFCCDEDITSHRPPALLVSHRATVIIFFWDARHYLCLCLVPCMHRSSQMLVSFPHANIRPSRLHLNISLKAQFNSVRHFWSTCFAVINILRHLRFSNNPDVWRSLRLLVAVRKKRQQLPETYFREGYIDVNWH